MLFFLLLLLLCNNEMAYAAAASEEEFMLSPHSLKYFGKYRYPYGEIPHPIPASGIIACRNHFKSKVITWEKVHSRKLTKKYLIGAYFKKDEVGKIRNVFNPHHKEIYDFLSEDLKKYLIEGEYVLSLISSVFPDLEETLSNKDKALIAMSFILESKIPDIELIKKFKETLIDEVNGIFSSKYSIDDFINYKLSSSFWMRIGIIFNGFQREKKFVNRYDQLFGTQILLECGLLGMESALALISEPEVGRILIMPNSWEITYRLWSVNHKDKVNEIVKENNIFSRVLPGIAPDLITIRESILRRVGRFLRRESAPEPPTPPPLPKTPKDSPWRYMHEIKGIGFSVFMHIFPSLRSVVLPLESYGLGREVIGDETYESLTQPFVQPPYRLNEDEMRRDVTTGGAAAAASSVSVTEPAAAAAASSADVAPPAAVEGVDSETVGLLRKRR